MEDLRQQFFESLGYRKWQSQEEFEKGYLYFYLRIESNDWWRKEKQYEIYTKPVVGEDSKDYEALNLIIYDRGVYKIYLHLYLIYVEDKPDIINSMRKYEFYDIDDVKEIKELL